MSRYALVLALLLVGCEATAQFESKPAPPTADLSIAALQRSAEELHRRVELNGKLGDIAAETMQFQAECANVDSDAWVEKHCTRKKQAIQKKLDTLKAESAAVDAQYGDAAPADRAREGK